MLEGRLTKFNSPMMVHFKNAPLAYTAMMSSIWLDAGAFGALKNYFSLAKSHLLNVLLRSIAFGHRAGVGKH